MFELVPKPGQKPGFSVNLRKPFQKLKFWNSLVCKYSGISLRETPEP
jgi:hypothetical protein